MEFLLRNDSPFTAEHWEAIDAAVTNTARKILTGRRFIHLYGPVGAGMQSIYIDDFNGSDGGQLDFFGDGEGACLKSAGRRFVEIPLLYKDFSLSWRDLEYSKQMNLPLDLAAAAGAAAACARREDEIIFWGSQELNLEGLLTAAGGGTISKTDWQAGENPFRDVAAGMEILLNKGFTGDFALTVSPDLYLQMQRLQAGVGMLEIDRVKNLLDGKLYQSPVLKKDTGVLVCAQPQNLDLVIGQDLITGYLGAEKLNHVLRVMETGLLRIKRRDAIVVFK